MDVQNQPSKIPIILQRVGVERVKKRLTLTRKEPYQLFITLNMYLKLPHYAKGANLSRFLEVLDEIPSKISSLEEYVRLVALKSLEKHKAECYVEAFSQFPYEIERPSKKKEERVFDIACSYNTETQETTLSVQVDGMSACPCSKAEVGIAHMQRVNVSVTLTYGEAKEIIKAGRLVDAINRSFSAPIYQTLKRPEEGELLKIAYDNAKFVEDICRETITNLRQYDAIRRCKCKIRVTSYESIHPHNVCAIWRGIL